MKIGDKVRPVPQYVTRTRHSIGYEAEVHSLNEDGSLEEIKDLITGQIENVFSANWELVTTPIITVGGVKHDDNKIPCELLSPHAALGTAAVLKFGAKKYAPNNWRKGLAWTRVLGAIFRHLYAFMLGEDLDPETGLPHIDHAACEIMFLQEFYRTRKDLDDRYKPEAKKE